MAASGQRPRIGERWIILAILFIARFAIGFQFQTAGSVTPFLLAELGSDYTALGTLVGLFMLPGLVLTVPAGVLGQRFGDRRIVAASLLLMALGAAASGLAEDYATIAAGRLVSGAGGATLVVLMTKMVTDWFVGRELFLGISFFIVGWPVGIAAGQALQPKLAEAAGWGWVFHASAILCIVASAAIVLRYRAPSDTAAPRLGGFRLLTRPELILVTIAGLGWMFVNGTYLVMVSFGPVMLDEQGVSFETAARVTSVLSWMFLVSLPLGGWIATRFGIPKTVMAVGVGGSAIVGALIPYAGTPVVTFALFGLLYAAAAPVLGALPAQVLAPERRGPGLGIYYIWYFVGAATLPAVAGYLRDVTGTATAPVLFAAAMMVATLALTLTFYALRPVLMGKAAAA